MNRFAPVVSFLAALGVWQVAVWVLRVPSYLVPGPWAIGGAFLADPGGLLRALVATLSVTAAALVAACGAGVVL